MSRMRFEDTFAGSLLSPSEMAEAEQEARAELERTDQSALQLIQQRGYPEHVAGERWLDTRPMTDEREVGLQMVDQARVAIAHALVRGLVEPCPGQPYLVRIVRRPA